jgi:hypothetical protein
MNQARMLAMVAASLLADQFGSPPVILSAYVEADTLTLEVPQAQPWDAWLPDSLRLTALARDPARRQALFAQRSDVGITDINVPLPVPPELAERYYYLIDSAGERPNLPTALRGTARMTWQTGTPEALAVEVFGKVALALTTPRGGGFVIASGQPLTLSVTPTQWSAHAQLAPQGGTYGGQGTSFWMIVAQVEVAAAPPATERWVFVQWLADTAMVELGCEFQFALFQLDPRPRLAGTTEDGCDV